MTKRKIITAVIAVILILAAGAYKLYLQGEEAKILTGTVEATKADVTPRLGGYLRERTVKEGDSVTAGQIIARLDTRELEAQLAEDEASLAKAQAQLTDLIKGARPQELREAAAKSRIGTGRLQPGSYRPPALRKTVSGRRRCPPAA